MKVTLEERLKFLEYEREQNRRLADMRRKLGTNKSDFKKDKGKPPACRGLIDQFPKAVLAVAECSAYGAKEYGLAYEGKPYKEVPDALGRYKDTMIRHIVQEALNEHYDPDSGLLHAAHTAWNALAKLELILDQRELRGENPDD